jgi:Profilin
VVAYNQKNNGVKKRNYTRNYKKQKKISKMSWQDYVDNQLIASQCVSKACIAGHDGGVWAKSEGFDVSNFFSAIQKFQF